MTSTRTLIKTTCPRDCYDSCGMTVLIEDGKIRKITGDADHLLARGSLCGKCALAYNGAWLDPKHRLQHPLRRSGPKGGSKFERVGWDEALSDIASRLNDIADSGSARKILQTHYTGNCSAIAGNFPQRFFKRLGATEVDPDTVCNKAGHEALRYAIGDSFSGFDPRSTKDATCLLMWGANPYASAPHVHRYLIPEFRGRTIVIDPIAHPTARAADIFLQLRPGTDAALAFALMNAALAAGLTRPDFIASHTVGWSEIEPLVLRHTPETAEAETCVPAALIREAAQVYATGPSLMWLGQGMQRQKMAGNAFRSAVALCAATGNIGRVGSGLLYLNGANTRGIDMDYLTGSQLARNPKMISHMDLADCLEDPERSLALFCWNNNILASSPQQTRLRAALKREDLLHVVVDLFQTDTADFADYVLPAASFLEFDDVLFPYFHNAVSAVAKVQEPVGEALPNQEIFRRLARFMNFDEPELQEVDGDIIEKLLAQSGWTGGFRDLASIGTTFPQRQPEVQFASLKFSTPSGRIEIASELAESDGHPRTPVPHADASTNGSMLRVLSPASEWTMNSSYSNDEKIIRRLGLADVTLNPVEAAARKLVAGSTARLSNATGSLDLVVKTSDDVPMGVALVYKGRWPKHDRNGANVNVLNPGEKTDIGESSAVHGVEAHIEPIHG